jgi:UDP-N-acetylmuramate: L-alanyl-gamma-D-glutamyl-meso-diaminopimelate ligase
LHIHIIAVAGTGMGALAGLLKEQGHEVSGSDTAFDPPMGPALQGWGIRCLQGFDPGHLEPAPDLVIVGNVCRRDNVEALAAVQRGLPVTHIAGALQRFALDNTSPLVVAGTHGKTTTCAVCAWLLDATGHRPGFLIGGIPTNFNRSFRSAAASAESGAKQTGSGRACPFVIEGDEYDTAYFEKTPKFWHYRAEVAIVTSIEHDHIDIYPTFESYLDAFRGFIEGVPPAGLIVASATDPAVVSLVRDCSRAQVAWYALADEPCAGPSPEWVAAPAGRDLTTTRFELFAGGLACGRYSLVPPGRHNLRNALAALTAVAQGYGVPLGALRTALAGFAGVARRQQLLGTPRSVYVYDDFAHHPTAVRETLLALRSRHPKQTLYAVFEPRSATACRNLHQLEYAHALGHADEVLLAPLGRPGLSESERLDLPRLARDLCRLGKPARAHDHVDSIVAYLAEHAAAGDAIALLSNGAFGGIHSKLLDALR